MISKNWFALDKQSVIIPFQNAFLSPLNLLNSYSYFFKIHKTFILCKVVSEFPGLLCVLPGQQ